MKMLAIAASMIAITAIPALAAPGPMTKDKPVTRAEVQAKVQQQFAAMDTNRDGTVTKAEFDAFHAKQRAERDAKRGERRAAQFDRLDTDKNGQISRQEFTARADRGQDGKRDGKGGWGHGPRGFGRGGHGGPDAMFAALDANKDGKLTLAEMSAKPLAMFDKADANKDGTVTPEERQAARQAMRAGWQAKRDR